MKSAAALAMILGSALIPAVALAQTQVTIAETAPVVTLTVTENVEGAPDVATVGTGVESRAPTAKQAMANNAAKTGALIDAIVKAGVARKDIQTSGVNLNAQYDYSARTDGTQGPPRFIGYQASNQLSVKSRSIAKLGDLLDRMVAAGATNINGPSFAIDDPAPLERQARGNALKSAKAQAEYYAQASGYRSARLISIAEATTGAVQPMPVMASAVRFKADAATPIEPGQISAGVTLTVQYALER